MVKIGQFNEKFVSQRLCSGFHIAVFSLCDTDGICNLLLRQIGVFAKVFDSIVQADTTF